LAESEDEGVAAPSRSFNHKLSSLWDPDLTSSSFLSSGVR
jgi:hypothetical protein